MKSTGLFLRVTCVLILCFSAVSVYCQEEEFIEIKVKVLSPDEGNKPLANAYITVTNWTNQDAEYVYYTDDNGEALIKLRKDGKICIVASKISYERRQRLIETNKFSSRSYETTIDLIKFPKEEYKRTIQVFVQYKDESGSVQPVPDAVVMTQFGKTVTSGKGQATISHNLIMGEPIDIYVTTPKNGSKLQQLIIGQSKTALTSNNDNITFTFEPKPMPEISRFTLKVIVLSTKDNQPVAGANVQLRLHKPCNGKYIWTVGDTKADGIATLASIPFEIADYQPYTAVKKDKYEDKWSDIPVELITDKSVTERSFTTYLKPVSNGLISESFSLPYIKSTVYETSDILADGATYIVTASGQVSCWYDHTDGVDACFCYAKWRCPTMEYWGMIRINEMSLRDFDPKLQYNASHVYKVKMKGNGQKAKIFAYDGGGYEDNNGTFNVTIEKE